MTNGDIRVRHAADADADELTRVMATAFMSDPVSGWIFPDAAERERLHPAFFRPFIELALADGAVYTTDDHAGVALWLSVDVTAPAAQDDQLQMMFESLIGPDHAKRFLILDELMSANHPHDTNHHYLPFIAVRPDRQSRGVGRALLHHRLTQLDAAGEPAYLEASCLRNAALYERMGFCRLPVTLDLPDGPSLYPMWRDPS